MTPKNTDDLLLSRAYGAVAVVGVVLSGLGFWYQGFVACASVFIGAAVALLNLWILSRAVKNHRGGAQVRWTGVALLKFTGLFGATFLLVKSGWVMPLGLAAGFGALPLGIFIAGTLFVPPEPSVVKETDHA